MSAATITANPSLAPEPAAILRTSKTRLADGKRMFQSRVIGALYLAGFLAYGTGSGLVASIVGAPNFLSTIAAQQTILALGAVLMLLTIVTDVWRAVVFFPFLGERGRSTALTYLAAQIVSVVMFFVGVLGVLLIVPLGQYAVDATGANVEWATGLGSLLVQWNGNAFQISQMALALGSLSLWIFGYRVRLIPRVFAGWALVGYVALLAGTIAEIFSVHIGTMLLIPGGLFELALPVWLFVRGFNAEAYGDPRA